MRAGLNDLLGPVTRFALVSLVAAAAIGSAQATAMVPDIHAAATRGGTSGVIRVDNQGDPIAGRKLFVENNCYICHGGRGGGGMCPSLRDNKPDQGDVFAAILARPDMEDLFAYIDSLRTPAEPTFTHWWEANPTQ
jgi:cytochrome c